MAEERPALVAAVLEQLTEAGYTESEVDDISLLTSAQRAALFGCADHPRGARHLTTV